MLNNQDIQFLNSSKCRTREGESELFNSILSSRTKSNNWISRLRNWNIKAAHNGNIPWIDKKRKICSISDLPFYNDGAGVGDVVFFGYENCSGILVKLTGYSGEKVPFSYQKYTFEILQENFSC